MMRLLEHLILIMRNNQMISCCVCGDALSPSDKGITWHELLTGYLTHKVCDEKTFGDIDKRMSKRQFKGTDDLL